MAKRVKRANKRIKELSGAQFTRLAALIALVLSILSSLISGWLVWALAQNVAALRKAGVVPTFDVRYDAIASAAAVGRLDVLSIVLAFIGVIAAISMIYGWTAFRRAAIEAAIEEVDRQLPEALAELVAADGGKLVAAALSDSQLLARLQERFTELGIDDTESATEVDDDPNWKEQA